jgi:protein-histidine pros-kinase
VRSQYPQADYNKFTLKLNVKFSLIFLLISGLGLAVAGWVCFSFLRQSARIQVLQQAKLMMASAMSMRAYTTQQILPIIEGRSRRDAFLPQTVPAYAATESFNYLRKTYGDYTYREATLNPTNLRDRTLDWEADVVSFFRDNPKSIEFSGERDSANGRTLYLAQPIRAAPPCLECHSTPKNAPASMIKLYGTANGFGWRPGEVVGAQIVSVPMSVPLKLANDAFRALMFSLAGITVVTLLLLNIALSLTVVRPVSSLAAAADEISKGNVEVPELKFKGTVEIATLAEAFNRMHRSLARAIRMLEP